MPARLVSPGGKPDHAANLLLDITRVAQLADHDARPGRIQSLLGQSDERSRICFVGLNQGRKNCLPDQVCAHKPSLPCESDTRPDSHDKKWPSGASAYHLSHRRLSCCVSMDYRLNWMISLLQGADRREH